MAIRDQATLDKVNHLNECLREWNADEITRSISDRLFWVLEWANNITINSELYASINNVSQASDITNFINSTKNSLPNTALQINYAWWAFNVANSVITLWATAWITDTQTAINNTNNALTWLNNLPNQIHNLRNRLQENNRILNEIHNMQLDWRWWGRMVTDINNDIALNTSNRSKCTNLLSSLSRIQTVEQHPAYTNPTHAQHAYYQTIHTNEVNSFNTSITGIVWITNYTTDWDFVSKRVEVTTALATFENNIRNLQQELRLSQDIANNENHLATSNIVVPVGFWLFNTNDTKVDKSRLTSHANTQAEIDAIDTRLAQLDVLEWQIETLRARYQDNLNRLNRILALQNLEQRMTTTHPGELARRQTEFHTISEISHNNLLLWDVTYEPFLPNQNINIWWTLWPITLNFIAWTLWTWRSAQYSLCDNTWAPLRNNWWRLELQQWWQAINIWWINFDNAAQTLTLNNLTITPIGNVNFPLNLDLNVRVRIHDNATWLDIDHHKPIHLEITAPELPQDWSPSRREAYDSLVPPMNERIQAEYSDRYREDIENEQIWRILREWWNESEVNEIYNNETLRNILINRVRTALVWHFPLLSLANLQTWFRQDMISTDRNIPVQYLLWENEFQNYLRQSIPNNLRDYASREIHTNMDLLRNEIFQTFLLLQSDIANNRVDNLDNLRALAQVPNDNQWPRRHRNSNRNNYTKFFQWRNATLDNLSLETEDWTIKYWVDVEVSGVNKLKATITIDGKDEPEIIEAPSHDRLIRWILERAYTKDWEPLNHKLRCNIALNILKAMVLMSPQTLNRQIPNRAFRDERWNYVTCDRIEAYVRDWNLRIRGWHIDAASRTRQNITIFDEEEFKALHEGARLEDWIRELSTQINNIMNATAQEYYEALDHNNRQLMRYNTSQRLRWGPVKKLRWKLIYGQTTNDFNFDTTVNEAWKSINVNLNKWLFTVSWEFEWQHYEFKWKNLWSILRQKINRKWVFDGAELAIIATINENFIQRLRENHRVQTENFVISDLNNDKTGRTYIFDEWWNLSYLEIEHRNFNPLWIWESGRINPNQLPAERIRCNEQERREFMQNPLLAWRLQREMRRRLAFF